MDKIKRLTILIVIVVCIIFILAVILIPKVFSGKSISEENSGNYVYLSEENNLEAYLENQEIIRDIPDSSLVVLKTYGIENREWVYQKTFTITGNDVMEGDTSSYDAIVYLDSKYLESLKTDSLCNVINLANNNGDLYIDSTMPETVLAWKFRNLWKYQSCLN